MICFQPFLSARKDSLLPHREVCHAASSGRQSAFIKTGRSEILFQHTDRNLYQEQVENIGYVHVEKKVYSISYII